MKPKREREESFRRRYGHGSVCHCIRRWRGRLIVSRFRCDCGSSAMTHEKAVALAVAEIGPLTEFTQLAVVARVRDLMQER